MRTMQLSPLMQENTTVTIFLVCLLPQECLLLPLFRGLVERNAKGGLPFFCSSEFVSFFFLSLRFRRFFSETFLLAVAVNFSMFVDISVPPLSCPHQHKKKRNERVTRMESDKHRGRANKSASCSVGAVLHSRLSARFRNRLRLLRDNDGNHFVIIAENALVDKLFEPVVIHLLLPGDPWNVQSEAIDTDVDDHCIQNLM